MIDKLDKNIFDELKRGSIAALKEIHRIYSGRLFFFINSYIRNKETSEELVQDVFIKLWNNKEKIDSSDAVVSFIYTIAKNHAIDSLRRNRVKIFSIDSIHEKDYSEGNKGEEKLLYDEEERRIIEAIERLSPRKKEVFELHRVANLTYKQIAEQLGISTSAVEKNISSALKDIKKHITK